MHIWIAKNDEMVSYDDFHFMSVSFLKSEEHCIVVTFYITKPQNCTGIVPVLYRKVQNMVCLVCELVS